MRDCLIKADESDMKIDYFNFSSKFTFIHQQRQYLFFSFFTTTFSGLLQGSQLGPAFAKAGTALSLHLSENKQRLVPLTP